MFILNEAEFEQLVAEAVNAVPEAFRSKLDNLAIVVEDFADPETLRLARVDQPSQLLGLYHGVPLTQRREDYGLVVPDKISIYRRPILGRCHSLAQVRRLVRHVVHHEIAHYFGISDKRLDELGAY